MSFAVIPKYRNVVDKKTIEKIKAMSKEHLALVSKIEYLEADVDRLTIITQALWELMQNKIGIKESELINLVEEIDLRDGKLDGKMSKPPQKCSKCKQSVSVKTNVCFYCGHKEVS